MNFGETSPLRSVIAYYPSCRDPQPWHAMVPALSLMGAEDATAPLALCQQVFAQLPPGTPIEARIYPEARHGFDAQQLPPFARFGNEIVGYNAAAAEAAARDIDKFMKKYP
jgi:dienelactone hydrolase